MNILALTIGMAVLTGIGWIGIRICEGTSPVLMRGERIAWSVILGSTASMLAVFASTTLGLTALSLPGFLVPIGILGLSLGIMAWKLKCFSHPAPCNLPQDSAHTSPAWLRYTMTVLLLWTVVKVLAGMVDLAAVPTYWDDAFNNWNMRGKIFFETQKILLEIPVGNGVVQSAGGVSSYPVAVPLVKTWLSVLRGSWQETIINGVHAFWFLGLIFSFYYALRRRTGRIHSVIGTYVLVSLPLLLIHGSSSYADVFLAAHVLIVGNAILGFREATDGNSARSWARLTALGLGLMIFTKNEAVVLYAPLFFVLFGIVCRERQTSCVLTTTNVKRTLAVGMCLFLGLALPWLTFKWLNGLTFGNAKAVSDITFAFDKRAAYGVWYHLSHEPNWLFLPVVLPLLILFSGKRILSHPESVLAFFVLSAVALQFSIFMFIPALATEAIMQTGLSRGLLHLAPIGVLLGSLLTLRLLQEGEEESSPQQNQVKTHENV